MHFERLTVHVDSKVYFNISTMSASSLRRRRNSTNRDLNYVCDAGYEVHDVAKTSCTEKLKIKKKKTYLTNTITKGYLQYHASYQLTPFTSFLLSTIIRLHWLDFNRQDYHNNSSWKYTNAAVNRSLRPQDGCTNFIYFNNALPLVYLRLTPLDPL